MPNRAATITTRQDRGRLTAVVPATDDPPTLHRCLAAIDAAEGPPDEVVVVDRAGRPGPAAARNEGIRRATGEVVCFVDADVEVRPDAFARIRGWFDERHDVVAVFGSYDDAPAADGVVSQFRNLLHHHVHHSCPGPADSFWAGLGAVRRDALVEAGGFDSGRFPEASVEDIELGRRLSAQGLRVELDPRIQGKHLKHWSLKSMVATDFARRAVPWVRLELERSGGRGLNLGVRHRLSALASVVAATAAARRRGPSLVVATASLLLLNRSFYLFLLRRLGLPRAVLAPPLHALHHLTAVAAVPVGIASHLHARRGGRS
jgi:GT2 family glycosyltransferase